MNNLDISTMLIMHSFSIVCPQKKNKKIGVSSMFLRSYSIFNSILWSVANSFLSCVKFSKESSLKRKTSTNNIKVIHSLECFIVFKLLTGERVSNFMDLPTDGSSSCTVKTDGGVEIETDLVIIATGLQVNTEAYEAHFC